MIFHQIATGGCQSYLTVCELGKVSTLAAATLRELGFSRATALDGGMKAWRERDYPVEASAMPAA